MILNVCHKKSAAKFVYVKTFSSNVVEKIRVFAHLMVHGCCEECNPSIYNFGPK